MRFDGWLDVYEIRRDYWSPTRTLRRRDIAIESRAIVDVMKEEEAGDFVHCCEGEVGSSQEADREVFLQKPPAIRCSHSFFFLPLHITLLLSHPTIIPATHILFFINNLPPLLPPSVVSRTATKTP